MAKSIVVCCDGTWNKADQKCPTNVEKFFCALDEQGGRLVKGYVPGVGTDDGPFERYLGGAFGFGLSKRVLDAYKFIAENFEPQDKVEDQDKIYLLGFSRGAYTARSVAGLVRNIGILKRDHLDQERLDEAYAIYRSDDRDKEPGRATAEKFVKEHSHRAEIHFIGVWDTVGSLGIPLGGLRFLNFVNRRWQFHSTQLSKTVGSAFHALAIDERRKPFEPTLWTWTPDQPKPPEQIVEQVWFSGVHSDVGGGYEDTGLSDVTLQWMAGKAHDQGLRFLPGTLGCGTGKIATNDAVIAVAPNPRTRVFHRSMNLFYRLLGELIRRLDRPESDATESVSTSADERLVLDEYRPPNLTEYLQRPDSRRAPMGYAVRCVV